MAVVVADADSYPAAGPSPLLHSTPLHSHLFGESMYFSGSARCSAVHFQINFLRSLLLVCGDCHRIRAVDCFPTI